MENKMESVTMETRKPLQVLQDVVSPCSLAKATSSFACPSSSAKHWNWNGTGVGLGKSNSDYAVAKTLVNTPLREQSRPSAETLLNPKATSERRPGTKMTRDVAFSHMKNSFSLTSLQINGGGTPMTPEVPDEPRLCSSLTRPRDSVRKTPYRRSWGSAAKEEAKDKEEFWSALQASYTYLMGTELIDSCKDVNGEMSWDDGDLPMLSNAKSSSNLVTTFEELVSWASEVEETLELAPFSGTLRLRVREEMKQRLGAFARWRQECQRWVEECPEAKSHVELMLFNLIAKWDRVEALLIPSLEENEPMDLLDPTPQIHCLHEWVREMESSLPQLSFRTGWTWEDLQQRTRAHNEFKREVEKGGAEIRSLLRLCSQGGADKRAAAAVEQRWQQLLLRVYEWSLYLEQVAKRHSSGWGANGGGVESDEEPLTKYCRVGDEEIRSETGYDKPNAEADGQAMVVIHEELRRRSSSVFGCNPKLDNSVLATGDVGYSSDSSSNIDGVKSARSLHQLNNNTQDNEITVDPAPTPGSVPSSALKTHSNIAVISYTHPEDGDESSSRSPNSKRSVILNSRTVLKKKSANPRQNAIVAVTAAAASTEEDEEDKEEWTFTRNHGVKRLNFDEGEESGDERKLRYAPSVSSDSDFLNTKSLDLNDSEPSSETLGWEVEPVAAELPVTGEKAMQDSKESIYKLVVEAEELIRPQSLYLPEHNSSKSQRVVEWLRKKSATTTDCDDHSCDASSELTSHDEDSDKESVTEKRQSCTISKTPDLLSTPTVESLGFSATPSTLPKVVLRGTRKRGERPWSLAGMPASLAMAVQGSSLPSSQSETALHSLVTIGSPKTPGTGQLGSSPGLDPAYQSSASSSGRPRRTPRRRTRTRVSSGSSSSRLDLLSSSRKTLAASGDETFVAVPPTDVPMTISGACKTNLEHGTSDVFSKKSNDSPRSEFLEDMSNFSEQAWDNYQEHYLSEPYSEEAVDPSRLLAFGDDYRTHIDSLSDNFSVIGGRNGSKPPTPQRHFARRSPYRKSRPSPASFFPAHFDSDSDVEEFQHVVRTSLTQLGVASDTFQRLLTAPRIEISEWAELLALCRTHVECLEALSDAAGGEWEAVQDLLPSWRMLNTRVEEGHAQVTKCRDLSRAVQESRSRLQELQLKVSVPQDMTNSLEQQLADIDELKQLLREEHTDVLSVNVSVHDFLTQVRERSQLGPTSGTVQNGKCPPSSPLEVQAVDPLSLKEGVTELYSMLEVTSNRARAKEQDLLIAVQTLRQFQEELTQFNVTIATDQHRLSLLYSALKDEKVSPSTISSVRRLTALVNRAEGDDSKSNSAFEPHESEEDFKSWLRLTALTDLNLLQTADSGISDGAFSEGELSLTERERKIAHLKRLVRKMESILTPGSSVLNYINENLDRAMREFEELQRSCRTLVEQTSSVLQKSSSSSTTSSQRGLKKRTAVSVRDSERPSASVSEQATKSHGTKSAWKRSEWLWRVFKASLPIHIALLVLMCAACLLEPHCCDHVNSLNFSFLPRLSYPSGPPPM